MNKTLGIACGDPAGIGPEITLKAVSNLLPSCPDRFVLLGEPSQLLALNDSLGLHLPLEPGSVEAPSGRVTLAAQPSVESCAIGFPSLPTPAGARAAMAWLAQGAKGCLAGHLDALVTAPVSKEAIIDAGFTGFVGQTEFLSGLAGTPETVMMLLGHDDRGRWLRVALATIHVPIRDVAVRLTRLSLIHI